MTATHTVIVGSGIIGVSTAYYLSLLASKEENRTGTSDGNTRDGKREHHIHLVDPAPVLFEHVASGKAGGFLARNWFSPSVAELGAFSFDLHQKLAEQFDGRKRWGWSKSTVINLNFAKNGKKGRIRSGDFGVGGELEEYPPWLNDFDSAQPLADRESTAQLWVFFPMPPDHRALITDL
jgi:glycine/D-amino acid oxidase-like deaminating enzyme